MNALRSLSVFVGVGVRCETRLKAPLCFFVWEGRKDGRRWVCVCVWMMLKKEKGYISLSVRSVLNFQHQSVSCVS